MFSVFTAPIAGYYNICGFFRFRNSGVSNDVNLYKVISNLANKVIFNRAVNAIKAFSFGVFLIMLHF